MTENLNLFELYSEPAARVAPRREPIARRLCTALGRGIAIVAGGQSAGADDRPGGASAVARQLRGRVGETLAARVAAARRMRLPGARARVPGFGVLAGCAAAGVAVLALALTLTEGNGGQAAGIAAPSEGAASYPGMSSPVGASESEGGAGSADAVLANARIAAEERRDRRQARARRARREARAARKRESRRSRSRPSAPKPAPPAPASQTPTPAPAPVPAPARPEPVPAATATPEPPPAPAPAPAPAPDPPSPASPPASSPPTTPSGGGGGEFGFER